MAFSIYGLGIGDLLNIGKFAVSTYSAYSQAEYAKDAAKLQKRELERQRSVEEARARQQARIQAARLRASQGAAGISTSMGTSGQIGIESSLEYGIEQLGQQTKTQSEQFDLQASNVQNQAFTDFITGLGTFAVSGTPGNLDFSSGEKPYTPHRTDGRH